MSLSEKKQDQPLELLRAVQGDLARTALARTDLARTVLARTDLVRTALVRTAGPHPVQAADRRPVRETG